MPMDMKKPSRKKIRLDGYDYSSSGAYFITVCTGDKKPLLWKNSNLDVGLSRCGETVKTAIESIEKHYEGVAVDKYCIMPNHIHLILTITADESGRMISAPTLMTERARFSQRRIARNYALPTVNSCEKVGNSGILCETRRGVLRAKERTLCA